MNEYKIYLKGGAVIEVSAIRVNFPDNKSKLLKIYISETETDTNTIILTSEVAALVCKPNLMQGLGVVQGSARRRER